jgi:hypothetical protein
MKIQTGHERTDLITLVVHVSAFTGLLPEAPRRVIRVRGRHRGPSRALGGTHTPGGCTRRMWNDQTGGTNRFLMRRADWSSYVYVTGLLPEAPRRVIRVR